MFGTLTRFGGFRGRPIMGGEIAAGAEPLVQNVVRNELVLLVGRDPAIVADASAALEVAGFGVLACSARALMGRLRELKPDIVVFETQDHLAEAADACRGIRRSGSTPIVVLGRARAESDAIAVLDAGADDYVREPLGAIEFIARVNAVLRRADRSANRAGQIALGPIVVDESQHTAIVDGTRLSLSPTEFRLLSYLIRHPNRVVGYDDLLSRVRGARSAESRDVLRVTMSRLRRKIGADKHRDVSIHVIARRGYRLAIEATSIGSMS